MRILFLLLAFAGQAGAVDVYLRTHDNKNCRVTGATNASPIVVTCAAAHHMVDGDRVWFSNIAGNLATNGLRYVNVPTSTTLSLYSDAGRTTAVAGTGTWNNGDNAGSAGGFQIAGVVTPYTLQPSPRVNWNPAGNLIEFAASPENGLLTNIVDSGNTATATYTRAHGLAVGNKICVFGAIDPNLNCASTVTSTVYFTITAVPTATTIQWATASVTDATYNSANLTISSWAQGSNQAWVAVNTPTVRNPYLTGGSPPAYTLGRRDYQKEAASSFATICYLNRSDTEACTIAEYAINHPGTFFNNGACDETTALCGDGQFGDFASISADHILYMYDLMKTTSYIDAGERAAFANAMLNDRGDSCVPLQRVNRSGTISVTANEAANVTLTGVGTSFLSQVVVGSILTSQTTTGSSITSNQSVYVNGVIDDNTLTVNQNFTRVNTPYAVINPRSSNSCGLWWFLKHHGGSPIAHPIYYTPVGGNTTNESVDPINNMTRSKLHFAILMGMVLADNDPRAAALLSDASVFYMDYTHPTERGQYTGFVNGGPNYTFARVSYMSLDIPTWWRNAFVNGPDVTDAGYIKSFTDAWRFLWHPNALLENRNWCVWAFGADADGTECWNTAGGRMTSFPASSRIFPASTETSKFMYWYNTVANFTASSIAAVNGYQSNNIFRRLPPNVTPTNYLSDPTQRLFRLVPSDLAWCNEAGAVDCPPTGSSGMAYVLSRSSWADASATLASYSSASYVCDHDTRRAGDYCIVKGNGLVCADSFQAAQSLGNLGAVVPATNYPRSNVSQLGGLVENDGQQSTTNGNIVMQHYHAPVLRWAGGANNDGRGDSAFAYALSNLATTWRSGVTRQHRAFLHYKRAGKQEYVILWDDVVRSAAGTIKYYTHYVQNGEGGVEGTTTCPGDSTCAGINTSRQVNSATSGTVYSLVTKYLAPTGSNLFVQVDNPDGTYTGGIDHSWRVTGCGGTSSCDSVTALEMFTAHKVSTGTVTTISAAPLNPSADWSGAQYTDLTYLHARGGGTFASVPSFTTDATTDVIAAGLDPGTYTVSLGGSPVTGCTGIVVGAGDNTIFCPDVGAGAITVGTGGVAPSGSSGARIGGTVRIGGTSKI